MMNKANKILKSEVGISMLEVLVSILLLGIMSTGVSKSVVMALKTSTYTEYNHIATSLAVSKMEELASINVTSIGALHSVEDEVAWPSFNSTFERETVIVINPDESRTITVTVTSNNSYAPTSVQFTNRFAKWE